MSDASTKQTVECPICEGEFDPTVAGGWCTNTECGEWQYTETEDDDEVDETDDGFVSPAEMDEGDDPLDDPADADDDAEAVQSPSDIADVAVDEEDEAEPAAESAAETEEAGATSDADGPTAGTEDVSIEADEADVADEADEADEAEAEADTVDCPDCGVELDASANFCAECGADVSASAESEELDACPSCEADVEPEDSFCVNCGEDLDAHRDADAGADEDQDADEADDAIDALEGDEVPDQLVLAVEGREISIRDGDKVGREIRAALMDAGRPEEEAVRIHREHVRFVREEDSFYLLDLGDNPTALNGQTLTKGDREPVAPGDEVELSGVTTVDVQAP